jgi:protein-arginine kinase activator protein McsA
MVTDEKQEKRYCRLCNKEFTPTREWQRFCCAAHQKEYWRKVHPINLQVQINKHSERLEILEKKVLKEESNETNHL